MSFNTIVTKPVTVKKLKICKLIRAPPVQFNSLSIDFDGDGVFGADDLKVLSKRHFYEKWSVGDGHCFFRVLHRFMKMYRLYTNEEVTYFKKTKAKLKGNVENFPEICYLRRLAQKFCLKIPIHKYGRDCPASDDAMDYAAESQEYGLAQARMFLGTSAMGYADSPDYEACANVLKIIICILQMDGKWQVFPDESSEKGFGNWPIMFAYNSGAIHFNSLLPKMDEIILRKEELEELKIGMTKCKPTQKQACHILSYFPKAHFDPKMIDDHCDYIMKYFSTELDTAVEMLYVRRRDLIENEIDECIEKEKKLMLAFSHDMFIKLMTYGSLKTKAGFKTAHDLMLYLGEKNLYLTRRDHKQYTFDQVAQIYLNGD